MKNYNEMANDVLRRIGEYKTEQRNKRKVMKRVIMPICCFCLAGLLCIGLWKGDFFNTAPPIKSDNSTGDDSAAAVGTDASQKSEGDTSADSTSTEVKTSSTAGTVSSTNCNSTEPKTTSGVTGTVSSTIPKASNPETTSRVLESNTFWNIDEVPPMVMEGDPVPFTVSSNKEGYLYGVKFSQAIVRSREELLSLCEENFEGSEFNFSLFKNAKAKYGNDYFDENALVLLYAKVGSSSKQHRFDCLVKKDGKLYAGILEWIPGAKEGDAVIMNMDINALCCVIEVKKSDVQGINDIEVNIERKYNIN